MNANPPGRRLRILSISTVFPNLAEPGLGLFVRSRLCHLAELADVKVIAPVPVLDYSNPKRKLFDRLDLGASRQDGPLEVFHPRWLFPPGGTPVNALCLFSRLLPLALRLHREFPFDLIDAHFGYPEGVAAALLARALGVPFTITLRGSEVVFDHSRPRRMAMEWAFRRAARVIAVSEELRQFALSRGAAPERTTTIPNGIEPAVFHPRDMAEMRALHGLPSGCRIVLSTGELIEAKGHQLVIRSLPKLLADSTDVRVVIAGATARGGPKFEEKLRQLPHDLGIADRVHFTGWVDRQKLAGLLAAADLFCLASFSEGWPNVVHEALATGTPVVASRVGGVPDMITSEAYGLMVPPRDGAALQNALRAALDRSWDRKAVSDWGRSRNWTSVAREVLDTMTHVRN